MPSDSTTKRVTFGAGVGRGVFVAPWMGPKGELILIAVRRDDRLVAQRMLPDGTDPAITVDELWGALEEADPPCRLALA